MTVGVPEDLCNRSVLKDISCEVKNVTPNGSELLVQKYFQLDMSIVFSYK